jgi:dynamin-binding protein
MMESVASSVNEGRRRWEIVQGVLKSKPGEGPTKIALNVSTTVNLSRVTSIRRYKAKEGNAEAIKVDEMKLALKRCETFVPGFARNAVEWSTAVRAMMGHLRDWTLAFARVIGLDEDHGSEAFEAFLTVVEQQLMPLCQRLEAVVKEKLLVNLARLIDTSRSPTRLIEAMEALEPLHFSLLNIHVSKTNRPAPALLEASQSYLALRGQLFTELPLYLGFLQRGLTACVLQLSEIQMVFYADVRERWSDLWDALRVDGEMNAGSEETERVWWERWEEVQNVVGALDIVNPKLYVEAILRSPSSFSQPPKKAKKKKSSTLKSPKAPSRPSMAPLESIPAPVPRRKKSSLDQRQTSVSSVLGSLSPAHSTPSLPTTGSMRRKDSIESFATRRSQHHDDRYSRADEFGLYLQEDIPKRLSPPRTRSMTLDGGASLSSTSKIESIPQNLPTSYAGNIGAVPERGRTQRIGFRRKLSDALRSTSTSRRRSPSAQPFAVVNRSEPSLSNGHEKPRPPARERQDWHRAKAKYACRVVHPCTPPDNVSYHGLPFFELRLNHVLEILEEAGHPSTHPNLPLYVDDGEDCLLLTRDRMGAVGWALASFLVPVD